jgi:hypothetical protein
MENIFKYFYEQRKHFKLIKIKTEINWELKKNMKREVY